MNVTIDGDDHLALWKDDATYKQIFKPKFLRAGGHFIGVEMFQNYGNYNFSVYIEGPGLQKQLLRAN